MELFDIAPEPKPQKPTAPQMRLLHALSHARLTIKSIPWATQDWTDKDGNILLYNFRPAVIQNAVKHGWVAMKSFSGSRAVYALSTEGREAIKELCPHPHPFIRDSTEILGHTLICKTCARALRCKSKQPTPHPASQIHPRFGPICRNCHEYLLSKP